jgi:CP family cyanate transporter-like MFS transporter
MLTIGSMSGSLAIFRLCPRNSLALAMVIVVIGATGRGLAPNLLLDQLGYLSD